MSCLFCQSKSAKASFLPSTFFNGKQFNYKQCTSCSLHYISPIPNSDDLLALYPPSYQSGVDLEVIDPNKPMLGLRFSYQYQFQLIEDHVEGSDLLDLGCGNGHFINNALTKGLRFDGAEFNPQHVKVLKSGIPSSSFFTIKEFIDSTAKYDLIRMSNVLEHFTEPASMMDQLISKLKPGGKLLIEGPIEMNFSLALMIRRFFFSIRKRLQPNYLATHHPTHIFFSNARNQKAFFEAHKLKTAHFEIKEAAWPFPASISKAIGMKAKTMAVLARISITFGRLIPSWGNTFIYVGSLKSEEA